MKKYIISAAIVLTTGITALSIAKTFETKTVKPAKVDTTELMKKGFSAQKSDISSAD